MFKAKSNRKGRKRSNWNTWNSIFQEAEKLNKRVCKDSDKLIKRTDTFINMITESKVA